MLLFITDRCPVGCAHCSVDSRRDSPTIADIDLFERLLDALCSIDDLRLVGISGGEPFVERRGLELAVSRLREAEKAIVLYTSGVWARSDVTPAWVERTLRAAACVFLSTDGYHAAVLEDERFVRAARSIRAAGVPLVVQVIRLPEMVRAAEALLERAFGAGWPTEAELSLTPPLPYGRGATVFHRRALTLGREFGPCSALAAPVVRYDGRSTACCNERVIMGGGPRRLAADCAGADDLLEALARWRDDPLLGTIGTLGPGVLTEHPRFEDMAEEPFGSICELCWRSLDRVSEHEDDRLVTATGALARGILARS